jgi:hypothetical protein
MLSLWTSSTRLERLKHDDMLRKTKLCLLLTLSILLTGGLLLPTTPVSAQTMVAQHQHNIPPSLSSAEKQAIRNTLKQRIHVHHQLVKKAAAGTNPRDTTQPAYNNVGISDDANPSSANFDGGGISYSAEDFTNPNSGMGWNPGDTLTYNGMNLLWPNVPAGQSDNYQVNGQVIPITPVTNANTIGFVGASSNGEATGTFTITYTDNSTQKVSLTLSDWTLHADTQIPNAGDRLFAFLNHRNAPSGQQTIDTYLFYTEATLQAGKVVQSVTLPSSTTGTGQMHVFMVSTRAGNSYMNNVGTSDDLTTTFANYDGQGNSYSLPALKAAAHLIPGQDFYFNGVDFSWPSSYSVQADNYQAVGQTIAITPVTNANTLAVIGSGTNGNTSGAATITYTDGSTQTFILGFADWNTSSVSSLPYNNSVVVTMPYRNTPNGKETINAYVFYTSVTLQAGKTIQSVKLPAAPNSGSLHVFAIGTK